MTASWPWLVIVGLGAFHGINPAMGWLFAVALGLHRHSARMVLLAIVPIGLGHAAAIAFVVALFLFTGLLIDQDALRWVGAALLVGLATYQATYGHRGRVRFGMQVSLVGLFAWSFLMANAHGAGLMLFPALIPLCLSSTPGAQLASSGSIPVALGVVAVHTAAMLAVTGVIAVVVYRWVGLAFLRRGWFNLDRLWIAALIAAAAVLMLL